MKCFTLISRQYVLKKGRFFPWGAEGILRVTCHPTEATLLTQHKVIKATGTGKLVRMEMCERNYVYPVCPPKLTTHKTYTWETGVPPPPCLTLGVSQHATQARGKSAHTAAPVNAVSSPLRSLNDNIPSLWKWWSNEQTSWARKTQFSRQTAGT